MPESEYRTDKILAGASGTYALGLVTGSAPVCFLKGTYDSPYGQQRFISGTTQVVRMNAPRFAGQCAVLFDTSFECTLISLTQKQDVRNEIVAGSYGCMGGIFGGDREYTIMDLFDGVVAKWLLRGAKFIWRKKQQQMAVSIEDDDHLPKNKMSGTPS